MLGIILSSAGTLLEEISFSIGKFKVQQREQSIYTMGFLSVLWGTLLFFIIAFFIRKEFIFSFASLPTFSIRALLAIAQIQVTLLAVTHSDRSLYGLIRTVTIPLLLFVDIFLGYQIELAQLVGIGIIFLTLTVLFMDRDIAKQGMGYVAFTAINAVATISLFKYNISHFNSVEAEEGIIGLILVIYLALMAFFVAKENPFKFLIKPMFFLQSISAGMGSVLVGFAFLFGPASIILTARRSSSILWAILSGNVYFQEKNLIARLIAFAFLAGGLVLLII